MVANCSRRESNASDTYDLTGSQGHASSGDDLDNSTHLFTNGVTISRFVGSRERPVRRRQNWVSTIGTDCRFRRLAGSGRVLRAGCHPTGMVQRLTEAWQTEHSHWVGRDLSDVDYAYWWADGVHFNVRLEDDRLCCPGAAETVADLVSSPPPCWPSGDPTVLLAAPVTGSLLVAVA